MERFRKGITVFGATLALVGLCMGSARHVSAESEPDHRFVRIQQGHLQPRVIQVAAGDELGWINATSQIARVSFERDTARHMVCDRDRGFRLTGEKLESPQIQALQFASMCSLAPGEYAYRVELTAGAGGGGSGSAHRWLEGRVIVR